MKNMFESEKVFTAFAVIDYCYVMIEEIHKKHSVPRGGIVAMIDAVTGYDNHRYNEAKNTTISLLKTVIKNKKIIEADYSNDEKFLEQLKKLKELPNDKPSVATGDAQRTEP